jgi:hypothetical protein
MKASTITSIIALVALMGPSAYANKPETTDVSLKASVQDLTSQLGGIPGMFTGPKSCPNDNSRSPASSMILASGNESSGGGDVILCGKGPLGWFFSGKTFLADTFALALQGAIPSESNLESEDVYLQTALATLKSRDPEVGAKIEARLKTLRFRPVQSLPELDDDNIDVAGLDKMSGMYCKKRQLAIQNFVTGEVKYNDNYYHALSAPERALFKLHEAYIGERQRTGDTTLIRKSVEGVAQDGSFAAFLSDTIYQHRMIPKFEAVRVKDIVTALFMISNTNGLTYDSWSQFLDPNQSSFKHLFDGSDRFDYEERLTKANVLAVHMRKYYRYDHMTPEMILAAYGQSKNPVEFAEKLDKLYGQTWTVRDSVSEDGLERATSFVIQNNPGDKYAEEQLRKEQRDYLQRLKASR